MNDNEINDKRNQKDFKGISFSKYKKTAVRKELLNCLLNGKIEHSCNWSVELICAGHYIELWEIIITFMSKHIHLGNPKLPSYIDLRFDNFREIVSNGYRDNELPMRNNEKIRRLFAEIMCVLCESRKTHSFESVKIKKKEEFDMTQMTSRLKAPSVVYAQKIFMKGDAKELFIAVNEFAYHISSASKNALSACYWLEWILEFQNICKTKKEKCVCERRVFAPVDEKYQMDPIWILWDLILHESIQQDKLTIKLIRSLLNLFCVRFMPGVKKKRRYLLYFSISLLTENVNLNIEMIENKQIIDTVVKKIDQVYKQVKKNEVTPDTDYLFKNIERSNQQKTIEKLEKMDAMNTFIRK